MPDELIFDREEFKFGGVHCDAHRAAFIADSWPAAAEPTINKYEIPGRHGTIRYTGTWYREQELTGRLYLLAEDDEPILYREMLQRKAEIAAWLQPGGRRQLIMDAAPDRFYMAEIEHALIVGHGRLGKRAHRHRVYVPAVLLCADRGCGIGNAGRRKRAGHHAAGCAATGRRRSPWS